MKRMLCVLLALLLCAAVASPAAAWIDLSDTAGAYGDLNQDYIANAADALMALKNAVGKLKLTAKQAAAADVDGNHTINATDALYILKYAVNKIDAFPAGDAYDSYALSLDGYEDPSTTYKPYENDFFFDTSNSFNGAYATDTTADTGFTLTVEGLAPKTIYMYGSAVYTDVDTIRLVVSLQGLLNRDFGMDNNHTMLLYAITDNSDSNWLDEMQTEGSVFEGFAIQRINTWEQFYTTFEAQIKACGMVLWDGNVPATSNVAATICGLDGYLPVLDKSPLYDELTAKGVPTKQSLTGLFQNGHKGETLAGTKVVSTGSAKNDAYRWAMEKYFDRCSANYLAYILDGACTVRGYSAYDDNPAAWQPNSHSHCLANHDYLIARRCFFFDLDPYARDSACDDTSQIVYYDFTCPNGHTHQYPEDVAVQIDDPICPTCGATVVIDGEWPEPHSQADVGVDNETMLMLFERRYQRANGAIGQLMGFPPWWLKYTEFDNKGTRAATWIEWLFTEYVSCYNLAKEADAAQPSSMSNGSAYYKFVPLTDQYDNKLDEYDPGLKFDEDTLYYTLYLGDYDSSAWLKARVNDFWIKNDRTRGRLPLTWCFNPNLSNRVPVIFDYVYSHKYNNEFIAAGDSGAGYVIPAGLFGDNKLAYVGAKRPEQLADGDVAWAGYCRRFYEMFDMSATGFIINGSNPVTSKILGMYNTFSTSGGLHNGGSALMTQYKGVPYIYCQNGIGTDTNMATIYNHAFDRMAGYNFAAYRTICLSPTQIGQIVQHFNAYAAEKGKKVQYVELYTLLRLAKESKQGFVIG